VPNDFIRDSTINHKTKTVLMIILSRNPSYPSYKKLKEESGISKGAIHKALRELVCRKIIKVIDKGNYNGQIYEFNDTSHWVLGNEGLQLLEKVKSEMKGKRSSLIEIQGLSILGTTPSTISELPPSSNDGQGVVQISDYNNTNKKDQSLKILKRIKLKEQFNSKTKILPYFHHTYFYLLHKYSKETAERFLLFVIVYGLEYERTHPKLIGDKILQFDNKELAGEIVEGFKVVDKMKATELSWIKCELKRLTLYDKPRLSEPRYFANPASIDEFIAYWKGKFNKLPHGEKTRVREDMLQREREKLKRYYFSYFTMDEEFDLDDLNILEFDKAVTL
jgi:hypothetical protein